MMVLGIVLIGATLYSCQATTSSEQAFFLDITAPQTGDEYATTMIGVSDKLKSATGVTVKLAFKVVGVPRILTIISVTRVCSMRALELQLESLKVIVTAKELYDIMDLATDLSLPSTHIALAKAKRPKTLTGEYIYFGESNFITKDLDNAAFQTLLQRHIKKSLELQIAGIKFINYNVLGESPMQLLTFAALPPRHLQKTVWQEDRVNIFRAPSMTRVVPLEDYLKENYCN
ncbi:uncharacterized protein [Haliotis asinina]|uniref:uncharacterized protein n=1 Tax=Haliotis asinina TaxID=109174 RepID=UPI0035325E16